MKKAFYLFLVCILAFCTVACSPDPSTVEKSMTDELMSTLVSIKASSKGKQPTTSDQTRNANYCDADGKVLVTYDGSSYTIVEDGTYLKANDKITYGNSGEMYLNGNAITADQRTEFSELQKKCTTYTAINTTKFTYENLDINGTNYTLVTESKSDANGTNTKVTANTTETITVGNGANINGMTSVTLSYQEVIENSAPTFSNIRLVIHGTDNVAGTYNLTSDQLQMLLS